jgi:ribbon-helix-helix CopG family protein
VGRRITVYLEDDVISALNEHTQASPLSRSELVAVALRRFLRDERRRAGVPAADTEQASRIARGELPSRLLDGRTVPARGIPWSN